MANFLLFISLALGAFSLTYAAFTSCSTPAWADGWVNGNCSVSINAQGYVVEVANMDQFYQCGSGAVTDSYYVGIGASLENVVTTVNASCVLSCGSGTPCTNVINGSSASCRSDCHCSPVTFVSGTASCSFSYNIILNNDTLSRLTPNCSSAQSGAEALLAQAQADCNSQGGAYFGGIVENNGNWCVEGECHLNSNCPSENPAPPALKKQPPEKNPESEPKKKESGYDYSQQCKPKPYYDALGRRTEHRPETRRFLFSPKNGKAASREKGLGIATPLKRENPARQCCVKNFGVRLRGNINDPVIILYDKIGIEVEFDAAFYGEEHDSKCNPSCCEFKQETKGYIIKNDTNIVATTCRIDGEYVDYDSTAYVPDCYGRGCSHFDDREGYDDILGTYEGTDSPGLRINDRDTVNIRMEFNSYIKDKCNAYEVKDSLYWGFHLYGIAPDDLNRTLLGVINQ